MTMILFVIVVVNGVMVRFTGYTLIGGDLFTLFLIVFLLLLIVTLVAPLVGKFRSRE
ncbi:MAG TPA: hypothetical protein VGK48_22160 [Terriglobia bacterium]